MTQGTATGKSIAVSRIHSIKLVTPGNREETTNNIYSKLELDFSHRELINLNLASSEIHGSLTGMTQLIRANPQIQLNKIPENQTEVEQIYLAQTNSRSQDQEQHQLTPK